MSSARSGVGAAVPPAVVEVPIAVEIVHLSQAHVLHVPVAETDHDPVEVPLRGAALQPQTPYLGLPLSHSTPSP